eukprot:m.217046 g.217046  ORF g.217046 m.217046 type:complete len:99 (-) comp15883_c0_seq13:4398-4694(-)
MSMLSHCLSARDKGRLAWWTLITQTYQLSNMTNLLVTWSTDCKSTFAKLHSHVLKDYSNGVLVPRLTYLGVYISIFWTVQLPSLLAAPSSSPSIGFDT